MKFFKAATYGVAMGGVSAMHSLYNFELLALPGQAITSTLLHGAISLAADNKPLACAAVAASTAFMHSLADLEILDSVSNAVFFSLVAAGLSKAVNTYYDIQKEPMRTESEHSIRPAN